MSGDTSEEKKHAASTSKLAKLKRDGEVAAAPEFRSSLTTVAGIWFLVALGPVMKGSIVDAIIESVNGRLTLESLPELALHALAHEFVFITLALFAFVFIIALVLAYFDMKGLTISGKVFASGFRSLDPVQNAVSRFSAKSLTDFVKSVLLAGVLITGVCVIGYVNFADLFNAPLCGMGCVVPVSSHYLAAVLVWCSIVLLAAAVSDYSISHYAFHRRARMTDTEVKRESKENFGSPELKQRLRERRNELLNSKSVRSVDARIIVTDGETLYRIAYERGQEDAPTITDISRGEGVRQEVARSTAQSHTIIRDTAAVHALEGSRRGEAIPEEAFEAVANAFKAAGLL